MTVEQLGANCTLYIGDNRETLREIPDGTVQCVVTSPPYYGLRDYGHEAQIGLEETPEAYVAALVDVFREVWRVLREDGVVFLNLGDSYASGKNLLGIPWRVAFALQADGWYLRQDIIWHKPNPMPESVTDRCTKAHEYIFLLSKSARYFYDAEAVKEVSAYPGDNRAERRDTRKEIEPLCIDNGSRARTGNPTAETRNRRSVWTVATQPYSGAHFATFPPKLIEPCILAGSAAQACEVCGAPWGRVVEKDGKYQAHWAPGKQALVAEGIHGNSGVIGHGMINTYKTTGYRPTCTCDNHGTGKSIVLDPFGGSGTTAAVALKYGRGAMLCELSDDYAKLIPDRIGSITDALNQRWLFDDN